MEYTNENDILEIHEKNKKLNFMEEQLATPPYINVLSKDVFENRIRKVFDILWEKLAKSFGPGGAGTFISIYPGYYSTKDGFTIMKNIAFDKKLDQVISDMVMTICNRLNFTVGDGTTTAVISTKSTYNAYMENKSFFENNHILPREILNRFENYKNEILKKLDEKSINIRNEDPKILRKNIEKVVYVSSNGNKELTEIIGSLYEELMYPAISSVISTDGTTHSEILSGYKIDIDLTDKIYINNDNNTMTLHGADIIIFDHKVMQDTYIKLLKPLSLACASRGRHLICIAPFYDETTLTGIIRSDLLAEYNKKKDVNLVLMVCKKATGQSRIMLEDFSMLLNTELVSTQKENELIDIIEKNNSIDMAFNIDNREIPDISVAVVSEESKHELHLVSYNSDVNPFNIMNERAHRLGYCDDLELGLKNSMFSGFYYDKNKYNFYMNDAKKDLAEIQRKCEVNGTFSFDLLNKQKRVYSLGLKMGIIEVGATSELSQNYLKDTVDDAVKAAASAYNNGVVLGCNVTLMSIINDMVNNATDEIDKKLLNMLLSGYRDVYKTVISNVFPDMEYSEYSNNDSIYGLNIQNIKNESTDSLHKLIIDYSIKNDCVLNLESMEFTTDVINSSETDKEILKATMDLLVLLITGNQLVLR